MTIVIKDEGLGTVTWELPEYLGEGIKRVDKISAHDSEILVADLERRVEQFFYLLMGSVGSSKLARVLMPLLDEQMRRVIDIQIAAFNCLPDDS